MKFIFVGNYDQPHSTEKYIANALDSLGHDVVRVQESLQTPSNLLELLRLHGQEGLFTFLFSKCELRGMEFRKTKLDPSSLELFLQKVRAMPGCQRVVAWVFDLMRHEFSQLRYSWACAVAPWCDFFFCTDADLRLIDSGANVRVLRQGHPGPFHEPPLGYMAQHDLLFLGSLWGERRKQHRLLKREFGTRYHVYEEGVYGDDLFHVCKASRIVVGPIWPHYHGYWSNRLYVVTGYGGCLACPGVEGMAEEGWEPWKHYLPLSRDHRLGLAELKRYLELPDKYLQVVRDVGQKLVMEKFTYHHRAEQLVKELSR